MIAIGNYLVIKPEKIAETKNAFGFYTSPEDEAKQRYKEGVVHTASDSCNIEPGTRIVYDSVQGHEVKIKDEMYRIIRLPDVALLLD